MKKLLFLMLALSPMIALADGMDEKEQSMPPIWIKRQPGASVVKTKKNSDPINLIKALDPNYKDNAFSPYVSAKLGYGRYKGDTGIEFTATPSDNRKADYNAGTMVFSLAFGVRLNDFRFELEGKADTGSKDKRLFSKDTINGKLNTAALMANAYYDLPLQSKFRPYVGAGLGMGYAKGNIYGISKSTKNLAWQLMAGIGYDLTEHWKLDLGYNYVFYGDLTIGKTPDIDVEFKDIQGHNITLGTRYEF